MSAYRALYRKWRPQRFEDVVGQQAIVAALKNQIASGRVGHAYLFTGVRGTGKTTCAKIFAKAVNCLQPEQGDPCGQCAACRGIDNGSILDVVEMDAASNNSVDDIREIRDETAYTPSMCKYKVYIIDEVHMLSGSAFNALLKTLEEPPAHVIFILATTEIQKVPATILSRCQRYDFTRITPDDIAGRVAYIAQQEQLSLTEGGAALIARLADGALRDALSILDTCAGVTTNIDEDVVRRMAGVTDKGYLFELSDAIAAQDPVTALAKLSALRQQSVDVKRLAEELINHYRSLMLAALPGGKSLLNGVSPEEEQRYLQKSAQLGQMEAIRAIRELGSALEKMTRGNDQRIELELAIFALTTPQAAPVQQQTATAASAAAAPAPAVQPFASAPVTAAQPFISAPVQPAAPMEQTPAMQPAVAAAAPEPVRTEPAQSAEPETQPVFAEDWDVPPPPDEEAPIPQGGMEPLPWDAQPVQPREVQPARKAAAPAPAAAKAKAEPSPQDGSVQPYAPWGEVVKRISEADPMLCSYLKRSKGYTDGKRVLIDGGPVFNEFIRANKDSQLFIKKVLMQVTGKAWAIGPYDASKAASKMQPVGNAEQSLEALRARGLDVFIQDNEKGRR